MTELEQKIDCPNWPKPVPHSRYRVEVLGSIRNYKADLTGLDFIVLINKLGLEPCIKYEEKIKNLISKALEEEKGFLVFDNRSCSGGSWLSNRITLYLNYEKLA